jgi:thiol peroxidase
LIKRLEKNGYKNYSGCLPKFRHPHVTGGAQKKLIPSTDKETRMQERDGIVTMKGNPITLMGTELQVGDKAPDFVAIDNDLNPVSFDSFRGKVCIVSSVPSLDTPVCDMETRRFNDEAGRLGDDVGILTISMDLPFAQKRWCGAAGVDRVQTLSDHRDAAFGQAYGVLIKGLRLLARAVFVVDTEGTIRYMELVKEIASEPDYDSVLTAVKELV